MNVRGRGLAQLALAALAAGAAACGAPAARPRSGPTPATTTAPTAPTTTPPKTAAATPPTASGAPAASRAPAPAPPVAVARPTESAAAFAARRTALLADGDRLARDEAGYYMDVQEARLRQLTAAGYVVARRDSALVVTIPGRLTFEVSSARLLPSSLPTLTALARVLQEYRLTVIGLNGYTDSSGESASNVALSQSRAVSVARIFVAEGIAAKRIVAVGHGAADPVAGNATPEGRELNRRIEVIIVPLLP